MSEYFVLNADHTVRPADSLEWGRAFGDRDARRVARTEAGGGIVSTVFLGLDHSFGGGPPLIFETMTFDIGSGEYCWRYPTWDEAQSGHAEVVERVKAGLSLDDFDPRAASGMEARSGETEGLDPKDDSPTAESGDAHD